MKPEDARHLSELYEGPAPTWPDDRLAKRLAVDAPAIAQLARMVLEDLGVQGQSISWWAAVPMPRRALIGDYLLQTCSTVTTNLVEAKLHLLELADWREREAHRLADLVRLNRAGEPRIEFPSRDSPGEDLADAMLELHTAGFFRALASSLDCLGSAITAVLALPLAVLTVDLGRVTTHLASARRRPTRVRSGAPQPLAPRRSGCRSPGCAGGSPRPLLMPR